MKVDLTIRLNEETQGWTLLVDGFKSLEQVMEWIQTVPEFRRMLGNAKLGLKTKRR